MSEKSVVWYQRCSRMEGRNAVRERASDDRGIVERERCGDSAEQAARGCKVERGAQGTWDGAEQTKQR